MADLFDFIFSDFDFNGDGKVGLDEYLIGMQILDDIIQEEEKEDYGGIYDWRDYYDEGIEYGIYTEDYDTLEEYIDALEEAMYGWRYDCEDGSKYGVFSENYETLEEYEKALYIAKCAWRTFCQDGKKYGVFAEDYDTYQSYEKALNKVKYAWREHCEDGSEYGIFPSDFEELEDYQYALNCEKYPWREEEGMRWISCNNKRQYSAAQEYYSINKGYTIFLQPGLEQKRLEICNFILKAESTASKYLTLHDGFLYVQAVKENFELPFSPPNEDEEVKNDFSEFLFKIEKNNSKLAFDIWMWCIKEFSPYKKFMKNLDLYSEIMNYLVSFEDEFVSLLTLELSRNEMIFRELFEENYILYSMVCGFLVARALNLNLIELAQKIYNALLLHKDNNTEWFQEFVGDIVYYCKDYETLDVIDRFKENILPLVVKRADVHNQSFVDELTKDIEEYIIACERCSPLYLYSRGNAWRNKYRYDATTFEDPTDYDTEEEYLQAVNQEKYEWREDCEQEAEEAGLNVNDYETNDEFNDALMQKKYRWRNNYNDKENFYLSPYDYKTEEEYKTAVKAEKEKQSVLINDDKIYTICGVSFGKNGMVYNYLSNDNEITIGDKVKVLSRDGKNTITANVVSVVKCKASNSPYPISKMKTILGKA